MTLFPQKKRIEFPREETDPLEEAQEVFKRLDFLSKRQLNISRQNLKHQEDIDFETNLLKNQISGIKTEISEIKSRIEQSKNSFENSIRELNTCAKIEDLEKLQRLIQEYDPIDFISYEEFQKMVEERVEDMKSDRKE